MSAHGMSDSGQEIAQQFNAKYGPDLQAEVTPIGFDILLDKSASVHDSVNDVNRPGRDGDSWPWKIKDGVHAARAHSWQADDASVFG